MAIPLTVNGVSFDFPEQGDVGYADDVTNWAQALTNGCLQLGGSFALLSDLEVTGFGLVSPYFTSATANPSSTGAIRLAKTDAVKFRNQANGADLDGLAINSNNNLTANGVQLDGQPCVIATTAAGQSIPNNTLTTVVFGTEVLDTDSAYDSTTGIFTVPAGKGGQYLVSAQVTFDGLSATGSTEMNLSVLLDTTVQFQGGDIITTPVASSRMPVTATTILNATAGQTIKCQAFQVNGSARNLTSFAPNNRLTIKRLV